MKRKHNRLVMTVVIFLLVVLLLGGVFLYIWKVYEVKTVYVEGNVHYTSEEIQNMVMTGKLGKNSLFLSLIYKDKKVEDVPFVQTYDVEVLDHNTIRIHVYEKALAGYVEYLGTYFYFDKDGMVVESSKMKTVGIPQVTGLKFSYILLDNYLPIEDKTVFYTILNLTQTLKKYELMADKMHFDASNAVTISFQDVRTKMGDLSSVDEKCSILQEILPVLEGKSGVLNIEKTSSISFKEDAKAIEEVIIEETQEESLENPEGQMQEEEVTTR